MNVYCFTTFIKINRAAGTLSTHHLHFTNPKNRVTAKQSGYPHFRRKYLDCSQPLQQQQQKRIMSASMITHVQLSSKRWHKQLLFISVFLHYDEGWQVFAHICFRPLDIILCRPYAFVTAGLCRQKRGGSFFYQYLFINIKNPSEGGFFILSLFFILFLRMCVLRIVFSLLQWIFVYFWRYIPYIPPTSP